MSETGERASDPHASQRSAPDVDVFRVVSGAWKENCFIVASKATGCGIVIDPGSDVDRIWSLVVEHALTVGAILLTHAHYDHVDGASSVRERSGAPLHLHEGDAPLLKGVNTYALAWRLPIIKVPVPDRLIHDGDTLSCGDMDVDVIHLPGHTPGGVAYAIGHMLFVGDTLLRDAVGRTDLPGGSRPALEMSLRRIVGRMDEQTTIFPGHGTPIDMKTLVECNPDVRRTADAMRLGSAPPAPRRPSVE